jgi:hypothetical protein
MLPETDKSFLVLFFQKRTASLGAGEGIRTLDPNLGKVPEALTPGYPAHRYGNFLYDKSIR